MPEKNKYYIELVGKTLEVLEAFLHSPQRQMSLSDIAQQAKLNKNAVFRILHSLAVHGYVVKNDLKYELGSKLVDLGKARLRYTDLLSVSNPLLDALRDRVGETVNLGILDNQQIRYIGVWESRDRLRLAEQVGATDMLHCSALGKAYLAHLPFSEVRLLLGTRRLPAITGHTITSIMELQTELEKVRLQGYAVDAEESMTGAYCIACAILNVEQNRPVAAVSVSGPTVRMGPERTSEICVELQAAVAEIQKQFGAA
ncbi:MAG: IclR family transcriptional regulator [Terracidiphilus sp.]|nr:IclR family transcriptional regulator [Terracidiphilus sp.]